MCEMGGSAPCLTILEVQLKLGFLLQPGRIMQQYCSSNLDDAHTFVSLGPSFPNLANVFPVPSNPGSFLPNYRLISIITRAVIFCLRRHPAIRMTRVLHRRQDRGSPRARPRCQASEVYLPPAITASERGGKGCRGAGGGGCPDHYEGGSIPGSSRNGAASCHDLSLAVFYTGFGGVQIPGHSSSWTTLSVSGRPLVVTHMAALHDTFC